ncbi:unnamed protein product [Brachionus calyciflorus]|uniref:Uncharacterized protein n=1 Tax=Brachionus calyciflorus TaxID=104777 RepID=A0A814K3F4_9BILA|nr:unnamed protein product [Brachionus calyciflorus]
MEGIQLIDECEERGQLASPDAKAIVAILFVKEGSLSEACECGLDPIANVNVRCGAGTWCTHGNAMDLVVEGAIELEKVVVECEFQEFEYQSWFVGGIFVLEQIERMAMDSGHDGVNEFV